MFIVVEGQLLTAAMTTIRSAVLALIATYFAFNMAYPSGIYPVLIFLQHYLLDIKDKQTIPNAVKIAYSAMKEL